MRVLRATLDSNLSLTEQAQGPEFFREPISTTMQANLDVASQLVPRWGTVQTPEGGKMSGREFRRAMQRREGQNIELLQTGPRSADLNLGDMTLRLSYTRPPRLPGWALEDPAIRKREGGAGQAPRLKGIQQRVAASTAQLAALHLALRTSREEIPDRQEILNKVAGALDVMREVAVEFPDIKLQPGSEPTPTVPAKKPGFLSRMLGRG